MPRLPNGRCEEQRNWGGDGRGEERGTDSRVESRTEPLRWACSSTFGSATHHSLIFFSASGFLSVPMAALLLNRRLCPLVLYDWFYLLAEFWSVIPEKIVGPEQLKQIPNKLTPKTG
jgi:hypothetical protein